jgi:hypothetical protein
VTTYGGYNRQGPQGVDLRRQGSDGSKAEAWVRDRPLFVSAPANSPGSSRLLCLSGLNEMIEIILVRTCMLISIFLSIFSAC